MLEGLATVPTSARQELAGPSGTASSVQNGERRVVPTLLTPEDGSRRSRGASTGPVELVDLTLADEPFEISDSDQEEVAIVYEALNLPIVHRTVPGSGGYASERNPIGGNRLLSAFSFQLDDEDRMLL